MPASCYGGRDGRWIHNAKIVSGANPKRDLDWVGRGGLERRSTAFVCARTPLAEKQMQKWFLGGREDRYRPIERDQFHRAVTLAGVDAGLSGRVEKLFEQIFEQGEPRGAKDTSWQMSMLPVLRQWLGALKGASSAQRAAGLLAAGLLLVEAEGFANRQASELRN